MISEDLMVGRIMLEVRCLNEKSGKNHYKMYVRPLENKIQIKDRHVVDIYKLKNGSEAKFINISESFEALVFD
jgi:hypothetical protein